MNILVHSGSGSVVFYVNNDIFIEKRNSGDKVGMCLASCDQKKIILWLTWSEQICFLQQTGLTVTSSVLTVIGSWNYDLLKSLTAPTLLQEKSYVQHKNVLTAHFHLLLYPRDTSFYQRNGESIQDLLAEL